jgi:hypothetical protein
MFFNCNNQAESFAHHGRFHSLSCVTAGALKLSMPPADALKTHDSQKIPLDYYKQKNKYPLIKTKCLTFSTTLLSKYRSKRCFLACSFPKIFLFFRWRQGQKQLFYQFIPFMVAFFPPWLYR